MTYDPRKLGAECHRCPLRARTPVPPAYAADPTKPRLIIVGMNPGKLEENRGIPFIGPSGRMLDKLLDEADFDRSEAHVTNAAMCASAEDKEIKRAVACCAPRLAREIGDMDPSVPILALGGEATRQVLGRAGVHKARGFVWKAPEIKASQVANAKRLVERRVELNKDQEKIQAARDSLALIKSRVAYAGRTVFPSVHPAFILRGADGYLPVLRIDIRRAVRWVKLGGFPLEDEVAGLSFTQTNNAKLARRLLSKMGKLVNVDIETDGNDPMDVEITCVGVADVDYIRRWDERKRKAEEEGKPAPRFDKTRIVILDPWEDRLEAVLRDALATRSALEHNGPAFDNIALGRRGIRPKSTHDTLIAHNAFASDKPKALAHVVSIYCDSGPWKIKFKQGSEEKGVAGFGVKKEDLAKYNAADVFLGSLAWIRMASDLEPERKVYEHDLRHAELVAAMQVKGLFVDQDRLKALSRKLGKRSAALLGEMRALLHRKNFNPNKHIHVRNALFRQLKAPTYLGELTPTGLPSTAAAVLETLKQGKNRAAILADLIIRYRSAKDSKAEYLDHVKVGGDGRVHAHWRSYGTVTGRPATRHPNILNIGRMQYCPGCSKALLDGMTHGSPEKPCNPKKRKEPQPEEQLRDIYIAPPGFVWVYFDLSQCFAPGTLVDTPTGPKPIEALRLDDYIFTYRDRRPAVGQVTQRVLFRNRPVLKVTLDNGEAIRCTPDHRWLVCPERQDDDPIPRRTDALRPGDRLLPFRKIINKRDGREMLYAHKAIEYSKTHIVVAEAALGPRPEGHDVHHKDEDCTNNDPKNLEYKPAFDHASDHGKETARRGWSNPKIRAKMLKGIRAHIARHDWSGKNNPRWGDRRQRRSRPCDQCGKTFEYFAKDEGKKFCSKRCYGDSKIQTRPPCAICRKIVRRPSMLFCGRRCEKIGLAQGLNHRVVSVEPDGASDVWSIAVSPDHNYALAAGVFVNNCEMRFAANLSGDTNFIKSCEGDVHAENAKVLFAGIEGALEDLKDPKGAGKRFRDIAKNCGFAISYLAEADKLYEHLLENGFDIDIDTCQDAIDRIHEAYARYYEWAYENIALCRRQGYLRTPFLGRKRWMGRFPKPTEIPPFLISGGVADVMNERLWGISKLLPRGVSQVLYQYDSAIYEVPSDSRVEEVEGIIKDCWKEPVVVPATGVSFLQKIDMKSGNRWSDFG